MSLNLACRVSCLPDRHLQGPMGEHGLTGGSIGKESTCNAGDIRDAASIPGLGRSPGEGNGNPLQYSCLENPVDRGV